MSRLETINGIQYDFGKPLDVDHNAVASINHVGEPNKLTFTFSYDDLLTPSANKPWELKIPARSIARDGAKFEVLKAFAGTSSPTFEIGLQQADGTEIDNNGYFTEAALPLSSVLDTVGKVIVANGALMNADSGALDGYLVVRNPTGTFTAGTARVTIFNQEPSGV